MLKTIFEIKTPTQTITIPSDDGKGAAIQSCTLTECVNSGEDLTLGSTCANSLEATLMLLDGDLNIQAGDTVTVRKQLDNNTPTPVGVFVLEKPTRATANTMKIVGYDNVSKLDKDLTGWLNDPHIQEQWSYTLVEFATLVCAACGLTFKVTDVPNADFDVPRFTRSAVTGRQIMQWLGEICCRFCHADAQGNIEFAWYTDSGKTFSSSGEQYYFQNGLTYENFETAAINAVQIRLSDSENGALWPSDTAENANSYIISGNPILSGRLTEDLNPVLENIKAELAGVSYTPCKVSVPACLEIHAGNTVKITDKNGKTITTYIMTKTQQGQQDTLECTGNHRRDSSSTVNNQSASSTAAAAAQNAVANMTQEQVFNKLTNDGRIQGIFSENGHWVINASVAAITNLIADCISGGILQSKDKKIVIDLSGGIEPKFNTGISTNGINVRADEVGAQYLFSVDALKGSIYDGYFADMHLNSTTGVRLFTVTETFTDDYSEPVGVSLHLYDQEHKNTLRMSAGNTGSFLIMENGYATINGGLLTLNDAPLKINNQPLSIINGGLNIRNESIGRSASISDNGHGMGLWINGKPVVYSEGEERSFYMESLNHKKLSWKSNGDGTYTLIGQ